MNTQSNRNETRARRIRLGLGAFSLLGAAAYGAPQQCDGETRQLSNENYEVGEVAISPNGLFVAFKTDEHIDPNDNDSERDIYLHNLLTGEQTLISKTPSGASGNGPSGDPKFSADGRFVSFVSSADDLVPGDDNSHWDAFLYDRFADTMEIVSLGDDESQGDGYTYGPAEVSAFGRKIAFSSASTNLIPGDFNNVADIFVRDRKDGTTRVVSVSSTAQMGNQWSSDPALSMNGNFVAFVSDSTNLVAADTNAVSDIFVHDLQSGETTRVSVSSSGGQSNGGSRYPSISSNGRYVSFTSSATNLVPAGGNGFFQAYVHDRWTGETRLLSQNASGEVGDSYSSETSISADGRVVAFHSAARNLVPDDTNNRNDVFRFELASGELERVSLDSNCEQFVLSSFSPSISGDGARIAFSRDEFGTNDERAAYVRLLAIGEPTVYCIAEENTLGCTPEIGSVGTPSASAGAGFLVSATKIRNQKPGVLLYSTVGAQVRPFKGGYLCLQLPAKRVGGQTSGGSPKPAHDCTGFLSVDFNAIIASSNDPALIAGAPVWVQYYSRDKGAVGESNLTDALAFEIQP